MSLSFFKKKSPSDPQNLDEVIKLCKKLENDIRLLTERVQKLEEASKGFVQKTVVARYNPFQEIGGDQSFSCVLLDGENNGVVLTSLYSRQGGRVYAKPIRRGASSYPLSDEEKKVINRARDKNSNGVEEESLPENNS